MKKKILMALLVTAMTVGVFTGCGNRMEGDGKVQAAMADAGNSQEENNDVPESEANGTDSEEQTPEPTPGATAEPTAEPASEAVNTTEAGETGDSSEGKAVKDEKTGYSFVEMDDTTMYAKTAVNVRDMPSTAGKLVVKLTGGDEVTVTGQCVETGWYRISVDGKDAYVSDGYIVSEKPSVSTNQSTAQNKTDASTQGSSQAQTQTGSPAQTSSTSNEASNAFIDYLNQQRAAAGLSQVTWDSSLAEGAKARAVEISTYFEHDLRYNALENIAGCDSGSVSAWFNQWYGSDIHRQAMMNPNLTTAAAAYYEVDGYYWVVFLAHYEEPVQSAEDWNATKDNPDSGYHQMESTDNGDVWNSYGTEGVTVSDDAAGDAAADDLLRELGIL